MFKNPKNVVIAYISIVCIYTLLFILQNKSNISLLDSSGLGSFLSGLFAPIAFLYLFLGHKQQEKALNNTNRDLLKQLKIQKTMLDLQLEERKDREFIALPNFAFIIEIKQLKQNNASATSSSSTLIDSHISLNVELKNNGADVTTFSCDLISHLAQVCLSSSHFEHNGTRFFQLPLNGSLFDLNSLQGINNSETLDFKYSFITQLGILYEHAFSITILKDCDGLFDFEYFSVGFPKKVTRVI